MFQGSIVTLHGDGYHMGWRESGCCMVRIFQLQDRGSRFYLASERKDPLLQVRLGLETQMLLQEHLDV